MMLSRISHRSLTWMVCLWAVCALLPQRLAAGEPPPNMANWVPPTAQDWTSLAPRIEVALQNALKENPKLGGGEWRGPLVAVDRTDGALYAFPQNGALWISHDHGQSFEWFNHEVPGWGFNESPTNLYVDPAGGKLRIFSSSRSGFSLDNGKTWKYMNFKLAYGFEDGQINWDAGGDSKLIVCRSHTWPSRMWISRDAGDTFTEFSPEIMKQANTQNIALLKGDVIMVQADKLMRSEDYVKTMTAVPSPEYTAPNGKKSPTGFIGLSRSFKNKDYWLNNTGVYTTADQGKTWTVVGSTFPPDIIESRLVNSGPMFGRDENQMLVLCIDRVLETLDGGKTWHVLAELPIHFSDQPWSHSFAYDPTADVLYCNSRGHSGGPYLFGRLALKRWGDVEKTPPTAPGALQAELVAAGNGVKVHWQPSTDASGIFTYRVYVDGALTYYSEKPEITLSNFAWNQELKIAVQAVDTWQNLSAKTEKTVKLGKQPDHSVLLRDLKPTTATFDGAPMEIVTDSTPAAGKPAKPITFSVDGYEPNPVPRFLSKAATQAFAIRVKSSFKEGVLEYSLDQHYTRLTMDTGCSDSQWDRVQIKISVDGKTVAAPQPLSYDECCRGVGRAAESLDIDLTNAKLLRIEIKVVMPRYWGEDNVVFANALLIAK